MATIEEQISSINSLINGVRLAQSRGVYSLEEAAVLHQNVKTLSEPTDVAVEPEPVEIPATKRKTRSK